MNKFRPKPSGGTSTRRALTVLLSPTAAAARFRCYAELPQQQPAAGAASEATSSSDNVISNAAVAPAGQQLPAAPQLLGGSPQGRWNAVSLAFLGDAVWEAMLRGRFYNPSNLRQYGARVAAMVTTQAQAAVYGLLLDEGWLKEEEAALVRWATNSATVAPPAHATRAQYKQATAVEALVAHLYLTDTARLQELLEWLLQPQRLKQWQQPQATAQQAASASRKGRAVKQARSSAKPGNTASKGSQKSSSTQAPTATSAGGRRVRGAAGGKQTDGA